MDVIEISDLSVREDTAKEDVLEILKLLKPSWASEDIVVESLSGGFSCLMFKCFNKNNVDDAITLRATNKLSHLPLNDKDFESQVLQVMSDLKYFPKLIVTFKNGYCYTYIKGAPIYKVTEPPLRISETQLRCIARKLADIHNVKMSNVDDSENNYFGRLFKCLDEFYRKDIEGLPKYEDLKRELRFMEEKVANKGYIIGLCHGDPHLGNIVWNNEDESATFVDWEITHIGFQSLDLAYFLFFIDLEDEIYPVPKDVPNNLRKKFIRCYLEKVAENNNKPATDIADDDINRMEEELNLFRMLICIYFSIIFGCIFVEPKAETKHDTKKFVNAIFSHYLKKKHSLFEI